MEEILTTATTPEAILGATSRLVAADHTAIATGAEMGALFQWAVLAVGLAYIISTVLNIDAILYLLHSAFVPRSKRTSLGNLLGEVRNLEVAMNITGVVAIALFVVRYASSPDGGLLLYDFGVSAWGLGGIALASILALAIAEGGAIYIVGMICERQKMCTSLLHLKLMHAASTLAIALPLIILYALAPPTVAEATLWVLVAVSVLGSILFINETFILFRAQRISIFHWILYLCTLELVPLSLVLAPIVRHS
ncbi:MAG: DUF4271 domain-containing protein [Alistipes sp.]|nr:DUF4271 domain-containing protein [Alistipes sp.]